MYKYKFPMPAVTVDAIIINSRDQILLIQRSNNPFKDHWALPGGFLDTKNDKTLEDAIIREVKEETGLKLESIILRQFKTYGHINRDPRQRTITVVYFYKYMHGHQLIKAGSDTKDVHWFSINLLHTLKIAFDHEKIIYDKF